MEFLGLVRCVDTLRLRGVTGDRDFKSYEVILIFMALHSLGPKLLVRLVEWGIQSDILLARLFTIYLQNLCLLFLMPYSISNKKLALLAY